LLLYSKKHTFETRGAKAPCLNFRIRERMFQGAKVPPWERKFQLPHVSASPHMVVCTALHCNGADSDDSTDSIISVTRLAVVQLVAKHAANTAGCEQ